jgi:hypothetical protein
MSRQPARQGRGAAVHGPALHRICPIKSAEFVKAYHDPGPGQQGRNAAINVNAYHARVQDMAKHTRAQALNTIPSWFSSCWCPR